MNMQSTHNRSTRTLGKLGCIPLVVGVLGSTAGAQVYYDAHRLHSPNSSDEDQYGTSVAIGNGLAVVGSFSDDSQGVNSGAVYAYNLLTGSFVRQYFGSNIDGSDALGASLAIDNNLLLVGAKFDETSGGVTGTAYLYTASTGAQLTRFTPSDGGPGDWFGTTVAIDGALALVGAPGVDNPDGTTGKVYAYHTDFLFEITTILPDPGDNFDLFGQGLALTQEYVVIGAPGSSSQGTTDGVAYVYDFATGEQLWKLNPQTPAPGARFGANIAIDGNTIIVGATRDSIDAVSGGAAYLFNAATGQQIARITPPDTVPNKRFGSSVDINGDLIVVGAMGDNAEGIGAGAVYIFDRNTLELVDKVTPFVLQSNNEFGESIATDGEIIVAGAPAFPDNVARGKAFILHAYCLPDLNQDGSLDFFDVSAFLKLQYDWNEDGSFDFFDISGFLQAFNDGCPDIGVP